MKLKDQVAIVTGGGVGIGKVIALTFAREGAHVVLAARTRGRLEETAQEIDALGRKALPIVTDVSDEGQVQSMVSQTLGKFGRVDLLVNNSGPEGPTANVVDMDLQEWNACIAANLTGTMLCSREVLKEMIPRRRGNIVNISSTSGKHGDSMRSPYVAAKWGVVGFTQTLALEVGPHNIRVNCICPGAVEGERMERVLRTSAEATGIPYETLRQPFLDEAALRRMVTAQEVANLTLFLASEESSGMTGEAITISAGLEMG